MNHRIFFLIIALLVPGGVFAQGREDILSGFPEGNLPIWHSLPQKMYFYSWSGTSGWILEIYTEMVYGDDGLIDTMMNFDGIGTDTINRIEYGYNNQRKPVVMTITAKTGDDWQPVGRYTYLYDSHGNTSESLFSIYLSQTWTPATGTRWNYSYDEDGKVTQLITEKYSSFQGWANERRSDYTFDGQATPIKITRYQWQNDAWQQDMQQDSLAWQSYDPSTGTGQYLFYVENRWQGGWFSWYRYDYNYDGPSYEYIRQSHFESGWENELHHTWLADTAGRPLEIRNDTWTDGAWSQSDGELHEYLVDGLDLLEDLLKTWNAADGYVNFQKLVYEDFVHYLDIREEVNVLGITVYPNPARQWVTIDYNLPEGNITASLIISDLTGKTIQTLTLDGQKGSLKWETEQVQAGLYFYTITAGSYRGTGKLVVVGK